MNMQIQIRDVLKIERADVPLGAGITLVVGKNGVGKTTLLASVAAVLTGATTMGGVLTKKEAGKFVRDGAKKGSIRLLNYLGGAVADVTYPAADYSTVADAEPPRMSRVAAGLDDIMALNDKERSKALGDILGSDPTLDDLRAHMIDAGYSEKGVLGTWERIAGEKGLGWDAVYTRSTEHVASLKGQWVRETGAKAYAPANAPKWLPEGYGEDLLALEEQAIAAAESAAEANHADALRNQGAADADEDRWRAEVVAGPVDADFAKLDEERKALVEDLADAQKKRLSLPTTAVSDRKPSTCPECGCDVVVRPDLGGGYSLEKPVTISDDKRKKIGLQIAELDGIISRIQGEIRKIDEDKRALDDRRRISNLAQANLDKLGGKHGSAEAVQAAAVVLQKARSLRVAWTAKREADKIHAQIVQYTKLVEILSPTGLRKRKLTEKLSAFNERLAALSASAVSASEKWQPVSVGDDLLLYYGGKLARWPFVSKSQEWRAKAVLRIAIAQLDGSVTVLLDEADILEKGGRESLIRMLMAHKIPAVIGMTCGSPAGAPKIWLAPANTVLWLDNGVAADCKLLVERAAA